MFGSVVLEVAAGLTLIFLVLSVACTAIRESIEAWMKMRSVMLEQTVRELFQDPQGTGLTQDLFKHPLINGLYLGQYKPEDLTAGQRMPWHCSLPAYIPSDSFALALLDLVQRKPGEDRTPPPLSIDGLREAVDLIESPAVQRVLRIALERGNDRIEDIQAFLEGWYDSAMERASGWYRRKTQLIVLVIGIVMSVALNVDTLQVAKVLYSDSSARQSLVAHADVLGEQVRQKDVSPTIVSINELQANGLPIGWPKNYFSDSLGQVLLRLLYSLPGWLLTAFSISLGAPFWFDTLSRVTNIRSTLKANNKKTVKAQQAA
ncbi:hypothetical protein [Pseudomonas defluvii]|uniref:hypothetical protein n=1 Tax=Pseudomonas defluvii TaxID=1876757 RepID=UPI003905FE45